MSTVILASSSTSSRQCSIADPKFVPEAGPPSIRNIPWNSIKGKKAGIAADATAALCKSSSGTLVLLKSL